MGKQLPPEKVTPEAFEGNDRHLRRLLRIKPGERPDLQDFGNTCEISAIPTSKARFSHTCFLSAWNFGVRIYAALATSTVDL